MTSVETKLVSHHLEIAKDFVEDGGSEVEALLNLSLLSQRPTGVP
jgi:hypothetical protein